MSPTARRKANAGDEQMPQQMRREGADGIFRIGMLTFDRGAIGEGEVKVVKAVEDHVAGGFGGLGDLGEASFLQIVNDGQFAEGFGFDGFGFDGSNFGAPGGGGNDILPGLLANRVPLALLFFTLEAMVFGAAAAWVWARNAPTELVADEVLTP